MIADDEDNVLRIYNAERGGFPVRSVALNEMINPSLPPSFSGAIPENKELDLEAATRIEDISFWLTSHALNKKAKFKPERFKFIALRHAPHEQGVVAFGRPYDNLVEDIAREPKHQALGLRDAATKAAEAVNGLNIEGMTAAFGGGVLIGFRNPLPRNQAIIVTLQNPKQIVNNEAPEFGDYYLLDLGGLGIRGLSAWQGHYLIAAGGAANQDKMKLFRWREDMQRPIALSLGNRVPEDFNPEAFFTPENRSEIMLLSDDGSKTIGDTTCKRLKDASKQSFRGVWLNLKHDLDATHNP